MRINPQLNKQTNQNCAFKFSVSCNNMEVSASNPITPPTPVRVIEIEDHTKQALQQLAHEEGQVILHINYKTWYGDRLRIWPTTFLVPYEYGERSKLVHAENIGIYPSWLSINTNKEHNFTLVFEGLPKGCNAFALVEDIPEPGGFKIPFIKRNTSDVYQLKMR